MGGGVDIKLYNIDLRLLFLISSSELWMDIDEFASFIEENKIENIFWSHPSPEFLRERRASKKFPDSKIFVIFHEREMIWTDSWGYWDISEFISSRDNGIFYSINRLKRQFNNMNAWKNSVGEIYGEIKEKGFKSDKELEESVTFFSGYICDSGTSKIIMEYAKKQGFRNISELIISDRAGFSDISDYGDAEEWKAPDIETLNSFRLIQELGQRLNFEDSTEALIFAILLKMKERLRNNEQPSVLRVEIDDILRTFRHFLPTEPNTFFKKISDADEVVRMILSRTAFSLIGYYDRSSNSFLYVSPSVYIDGSNVMHNGTKRGGVNRDQKEPNVNYLQDCLNCLKRMGIDPKGIYIDSETVRGIIKISEQSKKSYYNIFDNYNVTPSLIGEEADERLIKKLRDDPNCFVITNDSYDKYGLTGPEKERLIRFERTGSNYNFEMETGSKFIDHLKRIDNEIKKFLNMTPLHDLGKWPNVSFDEPEIQSFSIKFSHKLIEEEGREQEKQG